MSSCEFCNGKFSHTLIKSYDMWEVQLFEDQSYLGRLVVKLNRHAVDMTEMREDERKELFEKILPEINEGLDNLFDPDLYNYASLGNDCRHLHLHVIPRYRSERSFEGKKFSDENWNHHYKKESEDKLPENVFNDLRTRITEEIED